MSTYCNAIKCRYLSASTDGTRAKKSILIRTSAEDCLSSTSINKTSYYVESRSDSIKYLYNTQICLLMLHHT